VTTDPTGAVRIQLRIGNDVATATLEDSAPARALAAMLPTTIDMRDLLGRERPAGCPASSTSRGHPGVRLPGGRGCLLAARQRPRDLLRRRRPGHPQPGLVRLGTIDTGLEVIAAAGNDFELTVEPLD
jgi:hypothetical protein